MNTAIANHPSFLEHDTGMHPESIERLQSIHKKLESTSYFSRLKKPELRQATKEDICRIHSQKYYQYFLDKTKAANGHFDGDTPFSQGSRDAALYAAGAGLCLADGLLADEWQNGLALVRPPGHHAERDRAMGFCMFNNIAITARYLQTKGMEKIFILDWDVHHGNGTQNSFYSDPDIFFASIHQYPFYPGSGAIDEIGYDAGKGFTANFPVSYGSGNAEFKEIMVEKIARAIDSFAPDVILVSAGFDGHSRDPLGGLELTTAGFEWLSQFILEKANEVCSGRVLSFLEGGYDLSALADSVEAHLAVFTAG